MASVITERIYKINGKKVTDEKYRDAIKKAQSQGKYSSDMIKRKVDNKKDDRGVIIELKTTYNFKPNE